MKRILALVVALASLSACAQNSPLEKSAPFKTLTSGSCNSAESRLVQDHISGQIAALRKQDWESAYSYAAPRFQENVGLDQFIFVITSQYQMLIGNESVEFGACNIAKEEISQEVIVASANEVFKLDYSLSVKSNELGIESAIVTFTEPQVST